MLRQQVELYGTVQFKNGKNIILVERFSQEPDE
jgi:hypothetical protein